MKLRFQLLLVGALTGILPLVAYRAVQQMDAALRDSRAEEMLQQAMTASAILQSSGALASLEHEPIGANSSDLYAEVVQHQLMLDGYDDDWLTHLSPRRQFTYADHNSTATHDAGAVRASVQLRLAISHERLYLFFEVTDDQVLYHDPSRHMSVADLLGIDPPQERLATGDHIRLFVADSAGTRSDIVLRAIAPGPVEGVAYGASLDGVRPVLRQRAYRGNWVATNSGYQVEVMMPAPAVGERFGFAVIDVDQSDDETLDGWIGTVDPRGRNLDGILIYASVALEAPIQALVQPGSRMRLFDGLGRMRADVNKLYEKPDNPALLDPAQASFLTALQYRFFEWIITTHQGQRDVAFPQPNVFALDIEALRQFDVSAGGGRSGSYRAHQVRHYTTPERDQVMGYLQPLSTADQRPLYLLHEINEATSNAFTSSAMVRLFSLVTLVSLLVAGALLCYATWLSWRIRRLTNLTRLAVHGDGRIRDSIVPSTAQDEIGELSRSFARLVERSAGYTRYLESLASRLSHELRTPLSVVQTSLENLDPEPFTPAQRALVSRAQFGAQQLSALIRSMSEATRLEQTVLRAEFVEFAVADWLGNATLAYRDVYRSRRFQWVADDAVPATLNAVPELLQQALDKLIANAVDFSPEDSVITLDASLQGGQLALAVHNSGAEIDEASADQLFSPMYSERRSTSADAHLGLGLYIVRLISEAHHGYPFASNLPFGRGVRIGFTVQLSEATL